MNIFIAQIIGIIAILVWSYSVHRKEQYDILWYQAIANLFYTIQYIILNVIAAAAMNFSSVIRCYLFYKKGKNKEDISNFWLVFFIAVVLILGFLTYQNYLSLIPIIITLFYTVSSFVPNTKWFRIIFILAAIVWIFYNLKVKAYICVVGNILEIASGTMALIKYKE